MTRMQASVRLLDVYLVQNASNVFPRAGQACADSASGMRHSLPTEAALPSSEQKIYSRHFHLQLGLWR